MKKGYLGVDIGSISTKGVVIDEENQVVASCYLMTQGNPIEAVKKLLKELEKQSEDIKIVGVGTTGSARKLIGTMLNASIVKNEITAHAIGTLSRYPDIRTILEIGGQDSKIILIDDGIVVDYAMNTLCAAGTGSFLSSQAKRLGVEIAARCTVFAESDLVHKAQMGHKKNDIVAGLCKSVALNYLNNVGKGKRILEPIIFQGGVSKNIGVVKAFEDILDCNVMTDENGHLMGAIGVAILSKNEEEIEFKFEIGEHNFTTVGTNCHRCPNSCEIVCIKKDNKLIDAWGNRCEKGQVKIL